MPSIQTQNIPKIVPCLWFDRQAEAAAQFYIGIFENSKINHISHYGEAGHDIHGMPAGTVLAIAFELGGQGFTALNGGPVFTFNEAISLQVMCDTQQEIDYFWQKLGAGGDEKAQQCGWLKDQFGVSWQVVPAAMAGWMSSPESARAERVMQVMMAMKKLDIAQLERAFNGS